MDAMRLYLEASILLLAAMAASLTCVALAAAQNATAPGEEKFDVSQLFATTCGFCHSEGGRAPGRGPQLMNSPRDDDFLRATASRTARVELCPRSLPLSPMYKSMKSSSTFGH
jgi:mono/diheme cytochrome c family protein